MLLGEGLLLQRRQPLSSKLLPFFILMAQISSSFCHTYFQVTTLAVYY